MASQETVSDTESYTYNRYTLELLRILGPGLAVFTVLAGATSFALLKSPYGLSALLTHIFLATAIIITWRWLRSDAWDASRANPTIFTVLTGFVLAALPSALAQNYDVFTAYVSIAILASGGLFLFGPWLLSFMFIATTIWAIPHLNVVFSSTILVDHFLICSSLGLATLIAYAHRQACQRLERLHVRQEIKKKSDKLNADLFSAMEQSTNAVVIFGPYGGIEYVNTGFSQLTGYTVQEVIGKTPEFLCQDPKLWHEIAVHIPGPRGWQGDILCRHKEGRIFWGHLSITPIINDLGDVVRYSCVGEDITQLKKSHREMEHRASHDLLTGLKNRQVLITRLEQNLEACSRHGKTLALLYLDLDNFKQINDRYGHSAGDTLLCEVANRLKHLVRGEDTTARMGGDEFVILLTDVEDESAASLVADKILKSIVKPISVGPHMHTISTSIGISMGPEDGLRAQDILKAADHAMYHAKAAGRNRFAFFSQANSQKYAQSQELVDNLQTAFKEEQFSLHYQPWVHLENQEVAGIEALLRWQHPQQGTLTPQHFLEALNQSDLAIPVGDWVLEATAKYLDELKELGYPDIHVSVNISKKQWRDPQFPQKLQSLLESHDFNPTCLEIEISESTLSDIPNIEELKEHLMKIKAQGVQIALDDFGTGQCKAQDLAVLPFDCVKVDKQIVQALGNSDQDINATNAMVALAHQLNFPVIAEGVETATQLELLSQTQCDYGQGYLFAHPAPPESFSNIFQSKKGVAG